MSEICLEREQLRRGTEAMNDAHAILVQQRSRIQELEAELRSTRNWLYAANLISIFSSLFFLYLGRLT